MRIKVEACWGGNACRGEYWSRALAREALDKLEALYGLRRSAIRFVHH